MKSLLNLHLCLLLFVACNFSSTPNESELADDTVAESKIYSLQPREHDTMGEKFARQQLNDLLKGKGQPFTWDTLIQTPATAIAIAEPLLFERFGKQQILDERPYEVYLIDGYWYISGTLLKGWEGGAFEIIFSAKDGKIIRLTHYK